MKKTLIILILLTFCGISSYSQSFKVDSELKVDTTFVTAIQYRYINYMFMTSDNKKPDSLGIYLYSMESGIGVNIDMTDEPKLGVSLFSDAPQYDGKHFKKVEFESYELTLNTTEFNLGDKIYGYFKGISKPTTDNPEFIKDSKIIFEGYFMHIVGKIILKERENDPYDIVDKL